MALNKSNRPHLAIIMVSLVVILAILGLWVTYNQGRQTDVRHSNVQPDQALTMLENNKELVILDVREQYEYDQVHIPGSVLIPLQKLYNGGYHELDKNKSILVICRSGRRSAQASEFLVKKGFTSVYNLLGGILEWSGPTEGS